MTHEQKATWLMWICFLLAVASSFNEKYADGLEELAATIILLALTILTNKIIAYLMLALSIGKLIDGQVNPYNYTQSEIIWDTLCFCGAIILYIYRIIKKTSQNGT